MWKVLFSGGYNCFFSEAPFLRLFVAEETNALNTVSFYGKINCKSANCGCTFREEKTMSNFAV